MRLHVEQPIYPFFVPLYLLSHIWGKSTGSASKYLQVSCGWRLFLTHDHMVGRYRLGHIQALPQCPWRFLGLIGQNLSGRIRGTITRTCGYPFLLKRNGWKGPSDSTLIIEERERSKDLSHGKTCPTIVHGKPNILVPTLVISQLQLPSYIYSIVWSSIWFLQMFHRRFVYMKWVSLWKFDQ